MEFVEQDWTVSTDRVPTAIVTDFPQVAEWRITQMLSQD
jgi:hypothetical protein